MVAGWPPEGGLTQDPLQGRVGVPARPCSAHSPRALAPGSSVFSRTRISRSEGWPVRAWTLRSSLLLLLVDPEPGPFQCPEP